MSGGDEPRGEGMTEELGIVEELTRLSHTTTSDRFLLQFSCRGGGGYGDLGEWQLCETEVQRTQVYYSFLL